MIFLVLKYFFKIKISRFLSVGLHPKLLHGGQLQSAPNIAPGSYDLMQYGDFSGKNLQRQMQGPNWQQSLYTEQMAKIPHSSFKATYDTRKEMERRIGPGAYPITDFLTEADRRPHSLRGALDQLSARFPKEALVCQTIISLDTHVFKNRIEHHHPVPMVFRMKTLQKSVGNKERMCLHSIGIKVQEHYHFK
jgi:hypothetical protein